MAQAKSNASPQDDIDQLSEQISALKQDIADISKSLADLGSSSRDAAVEQARKTASELRAAGERNLHRAQNQASEMGQQANDAIRHHPTAAVGLAVGAGFLLGFMTGRK